MSQQPPPNDPAGPTNRIPDPPGIDPVPTEGNGPGGNHVGVVGIVALTAYLILFSIFLVYCLVVVWPVPTPSGQGKETAAAAMTPSQTPSPVATPSPNRAATAGGATPTPTTTPTPTASPTPTTLGTEAAKQTPAPSPTPTAVAAPEPETINFLAWQIKIWKEQRLLLLVLLAGALGSLVHDIRSVYWYIGNRSLVKSWLVMYLLLPFAGATLALVFYLVVRGGFFSPQSGVEQTSPFGFTAMAALVGMFSPQAALKLREVSETLLSKPQPGANAKPQESIPPVPPPPPIPGGKVS